MEQLHAPAGRRRGGRGQAQGGAGQGSPGHGQRSAGPVANAAQPRRLLRAPDPPAGAGIGAPPLHRRGCLRRSPARRHQDDEQRRRDRDLPARRIDGEEDRPGSHALRTTLDVAQSPSARSFRVEQSKREIPGCRGPNLEKFLAGWESHGSGFSAITAQRILPIRPTASRDGHRLSIRQTRYPCCLFFQEILHARVKTHLARFYMLRVVLRKWQACIKLDAILKTERNRLYEHLPRSNGVTVKYLSMRQIVYRLSALVVK